MPPLENPRHERFVQELVKGKPVRHAYRLAGYEGRANYCVRLRHLPAVQRRYDELIAALAHRTELTAIRIMNELAAIAFANIADYWTIGDDGVPRPNLAQITRGEAAALVEVTIDERAQGAARVRFKLGDKRAALVDLAKMLGLFRESVEQSPPPRPEMSDFEAVKRIAFILRKAGMTTLESEPHSGIADGSGGG